MATSEKPQVLGIDGRVLDDRFHGIGRITYELLVRLATGEREIVLFLDEGQQSQRFDLDAIAGLPGVRAVPFRHGLSSVTQFLAWPSALRKAGVGVALFPYHLGAAVIGARRRVAVIHDCIFEEDRSYAPDTRTRLLYIALTKVVARRTTVVTPSLASAAAVGRFHHVRVPPEHVVEWGVGGQFSSAVTRPEVVNGRTIPDTYFLHVGARRPHKNVPHLVRVLASLPAHHHLILVGSADPRWPDETMSTARELGVADRVIELSSVSEADLLGLYAGARAFLYPSFVEGFGLPLLEAMAAGTPVLASDIPVFREVAEGAGLLAPPAEVEPWVRAVERLDDDVQRAAMIEGGRRRTAVTTWDRAAQRLEELIR